MWHPLNESIWIQTETRDNRRLDSDAARMGVQIDRGSVSRVFEVEIADAFGRVSHAELPHKLRVQGVDGILLKWIGSCLKDRHLAAAVVGHVPPCFLFELEFPRPEFWAPSSSRCMSMIWRITFN